MGTRQTELHLKGNKAFQLSRLKDSSKLSIFSGGKCYVKKSLFYTTVARFKFTCKTLRCAWLEKHVGPPTPPKKEEEILSHLKIQLLIFYPKLRSANIDLFYLQSFPLKKKKNSSCTYISYITRLESMISKYWCLIFLEYLSKSQIFLLYGRFK